MKAGREVAMRVFAGEYRHATMEYNEGGERSPSFLISPMGAKINRLFVAGTLTEVSRVGTDDEPVWRAKILDGTGAFFISAGRYQPVAASVLSQIEPPQFVAVVGKSRLYSPDDSSHYLSIRPEAVKVIDQHERDIWVLQAAKGLRMRIEAFQEAMRMETPDSKELMSLGYSEHIAEGVALAYEYYGEPDFEAYRALLLRGLKSLLPEYKQDYELESLEEEEGEEEEVDEELERTFLDLVEELSTGNRGAEISRIYEEGKKRGLSREDLEDMLHYLLENGSLYEPQLGRVKIT